MSCQDCFSGHQHDGKPRGTMIKFHDLDTYVVEPPEGRQAKGIIVIIPDAFGMQFVNSQLLADTYAMKGDYRVYLPDFMRGHSCPSWFLDTMKALVAPGNYLSKPYHFCWGIYASVPWLYYNRHRYTFPVVKTFFEALRRNEGSALPVGVAGFCWGGEHTLLLTHQENYLNLDGSPKPMVDAAFTGHPSSVSIPDDFEKITVPTSFAIPEKDHHVRAPKDTDLLCEIMDGKPEGQRGEVKVYAGCAHGFCVRGDVFGLAEDVSKQASEAEDQAIAWFNLKLGIEPLS